MSRTDPGLVVDRADLKNVAQTYARDALVGDLRVQGMPLEELGYPSTDVGLRVRVRSGAGTELIKQISSPDSPVGIDAKYTHAVIIDYLQQITSRLDEIERRLNETKTN